MGGHVRASRTGLLHPSLGGLVGVRERLWPWVDTGGCAFLSLKVCLKTSEGHLKTFRGSKISRKLRESRLWK